MGSQTSSFRNHRSLIDEASDGLNNYYHQQQSHPALSLPPDICSRFRSAQVGRIRSAPGVGNSLNSRSHSLDRQPRPFLSSSSSRRSRFRSSSVPVAHSGGGATVTLTPVPGESENSFPLCDARRDPVQDVGSCSVRVPDATASTTVKKKPATCAGRAGSEREPEPHGYRPFSGTTPTGSATRGVSVHAKNYASKLDVGATTCLSNSGKRVSSKARRAPYQWHSNFLSNSVPAATGGLDYQVLALEAVTSKEASDCNAVTWNHEEKEVPQTYAELLRYVSHQTHFIASRRPGAFQPTFPSWCHAASDTDTSSGTSLEDAIETFISDVSLKQQTQQDSDQRIPCVFSWTHGGHNVYLVGSFHNWSVAHASRMIRSGHEFIAIQELPRGIHYFKFLVDDQWRCTPNYPTHVDSQGNINNVLDISQYQFYNFLVEKEHEKARKETFHQYIPNSNDYTTDAPAVPALLSKSYCAATEPPVRLGAPLQALANHVYHDSQAGQLLGPNIACITATQRWRRYHRSEVSTAGKRFSTMTYLTFNPLFPCHGDPVFELQAASPLSQILGPWKTGNSSPWAQPSAPHSPSAL